MERMISQIIIYEPTNQEKKEWRRARKHYYEAWLDNMNICNMGMERITQQMNAKGGLASVKMYTKAYIDKKDGTGLLEIWGNEEDFAKVPQEQLDQLSAAIQQAWNKGDLG